MRIALALLLLALAPRLASADQVQDLTRLVQAAAVSPNPAMAFLSGAAALPDFTLERADVQRALDAAGVPDEGSLRQLLGPTTRLAKQGTTIALARSEPTKLAMGEGAIELGKAVQVRLRMQGTEATIDEVTGISVGKTADDLYPLRNVRFFQEHGRPWAKLTAGYGWPLQGTELVDLSPKATQRVQSGESQPAPTGTGITGALKKP